MVNSGLYFPGAMTDEAYLMFARHQGRYQPLDRWWVFCCLQSSNFESAYAWAWSDAIGLSEALNKPGKRLSSADTRRALGMSWWRWHVTVWRARWRRFW